MKKINYYLIGLLILVLAFLFDDKILIFFIGIRINFLNSIATFIYNIEGYMLFAFMLFILLITKQKKKIIPLIVSFFLYFVITTLIKNIALRPRPFTKFNFPVLVNEINNMKSFPSGHATAASTLIPFFKFNNTLYHVWILIAIIVSLSRVYLGVHYLSDVIAGFLLGNLIGDISLKLILKKSNRKPKNHHRKV